MDRTAWIVITLCVIGLVFWEIYVMRQMQLHPVARQVSPTPSSLVSSTPIPGSSPVAQLSPTPAPSVQQQFPEKVEALSNADAELHLTNRGGAIKEVVLRNHIAEGGRRVVLNSDANIPIGAILDQPNDLVLSEFTPTRSSDSSVQYETVTSDHITVRKRFSFMPSTEKKDNSSIFFSHSQSLFLLQHSHVGHSCDDVQPRGLSGPAQRNVPVPARIGK